MKHRGYLVVGFDGSMRATKRKPGPESGKVVYEVNVEIPDAWTEPVGKIQLDFPDPPDVLGDVVQLAKDLRKDV